MPTFFEIAAPLANRGIPVIRVQPNSKAAMDSDWPSLATTNLEILQKWSQETPNANVGCVAKAEIGGFFFFEMDAAGEALRIKNETQKALPQTLLVRSRPGRGHLYFRQSPESIALGNVAQGQVKGGGFSVRVHNQYVLGPNSVHPITGLPYQIVEDAPIVECPQWLVDWIQSQRIASPVPNVVNEPGSAIIMGSRNSTLASIAGKFRANGVSEESILFELNRINDERCVPPLPSDEVETIARSISKYKQGEPGPQVLFGGKPGGLYPSEIQMESGSSSEVQLAQVEEEEPVVINSLPYPVFPTWVMQGTSIYEGLIQPWCEKNSRYPEYMFMPAMAILLNFIGLRVRVSMNHFIPALHMVLIGRKGRVIKSSCAESAMEYFKGVGMADDARSTGTADGRVLIWTAGSPEGLGIDMERKNCRNALLFYDELRGLVAKASIENSGMISALLQTYESGKYSNVVTNRKNSFNFDPKSYCMSFIACTTDKSFRKQWSSLSGEASGLNDRFFFLYQPKVLMPVTPKRDVMTQDGALRTRKLVDKAIDKKVYDIDEEDKQLRFALDVYSNRAVHRAERFALYFAIDLDKNEIDGDCIERALALTEYETAVKKYLRIGQSDAETREAVIQNEIRFQLQQGGGKAEERDLYRLVGYRYGFSIWNQCVKSMLDAGEVRKSGAGKKSDPKILVLMQQNEYEEED
jgi:Bifunctional DNA primase/polymerase, N-terminal/Primase C terminal 1 (PriCT-1)